ncbi:hypothetical protein P7L53_08210 [Thermoleptolyngbya sichuanensis XZ-Cy5]|uniref:hypothetical protein n=1 Tax=Thermoleptolyngbya sichuanensis TaxID=2885951 RepID=UPI00240DAE7E|nr:hypothetical protein [Thermoleptolyngbya sichuanensis]MDG2616227.1 hypothetical protein [Thermoleptolyngbya sichuanensis XZ-Cy5]
MRQELPRNRKIICLQAGVPLPQAAIAPLLPYASREKYSDPTKNLSGDRAKQVFPSPNSNPLSPQRWRAITPG